MFSLKGYRSRARSLADLLPYAFLVQKDVIVQKDGGLLAAWLVKGIDADSATATDLERVSVMANSALMQLDSGYAVFVNTIRMPVNAYHEQDAKHWPDPVSALIDDERRQAFSQGKHFASKIYLAITYTPPIRKEKLLALAKAEQNSEKQLFDKALNTFTSRCQELEDSLATVLKLTRLSAAPKEEDVKGPLFSSLLSFVELCITGKNHPRMLMTPMYLDACLGLEDFTGGLAPKIGTQHISVIALDGLPSKSFPAMLASLDTLAIPYRFSTRFLCLDKQEALHEVEQYSKTWGQRILGIMSEVLNTSPKANKDAMSMYEDAENAYANVQGDKYRCGFYTANIVLLHENKEELHEYSRIVRREVQNMGFGCRFEDINAVEAWLSTQVGNVTANVRRPLLTTHNLADMLPLSTIWAGRGENPCPLYPKHSPPLTYCATNGSTPFRLNLHVDDVGHTLIFGPTGAGKEGCVSQCSREEKKQAPPLPHCLSSLQKLASAKYGMTAQSVLDVAQKLYDQGFATYPRSDCRYLPDEQFADAPSILGSCLDKVDCTLRSAAWNTTKITAHHAIIPTKQSPSSLSADEQKIYDLIFQAYMQQFQKPLHYVALKIVVNIADHAFTATGRHILDAGYTADMDADTEKDDANEAENLPTVQQGDTVICSKVDMLAKKTKPSPRFTEGTLIDAMAHIDRYITDHAAKATLKENAGIGTEATRANILETLKKRGYIKADKKNLVSTDLGKQLIALCPPVLKDPVTTALWEQQLESIVHGGNTLASFMAAQTQALPAIIQAIFNNTAGDIPPQFACPTCGKALLRKNGKKGFFWGCAGYPACTASFPDAQGKPDTKARKPKAAPMSEFPCPTCGKPLVKHNGTKGVFWGCSGYRESGCRTTLQDACGKPDFEGK